MSRNCVTSVYGTVGKEQYFFELVIFHGVPGIGYMKRNNLISFIPLDELERILNEREYRYVDYMLEAA